MGQDKTITTIAKDFQLLRLFKQLDDGDGKLSATEVDKNNDGYLDCSSITAKWSIAQFDKVQKILKTHGLISKIKLFSCKSSLPGLKEKEELRGSSKGGQILYIRQVHKRQEDNPEKKKIVAQYQLQILKLLVARRPKHVFVESLYEDLSTNHPSRKAGVAKFIRQIFRGKQTKVNRELQLETLYLYGAALVYACLHPDVHLHKTLTKAESDLIDGRIRSDGLDMNLVFHKREELAAREVRNFLLKNPTETPVIIYGASHIFKDDFGRLMPQPRLVSASFPTLLAQHQMTHFRSMGFSFTGSRIGHSGIERVTQSDLDKMDPEEPGQADSFISDARNQPVMQLKGIKKAKRISDGAFQHIKTEEGQLMALDKLEYDFNWWSKFNDGSLTIFLIRNALNDKVRKKLFAILMLRALFMAPFSIFFGSRIF